MDKTNFIKCEPPWIPEDTSQVVSSEESEKAKQDQSPKEAMNDPESFSDDETKIECISIKVDPGVLIGNSTSDNELGSECEPVDDMLDMRNANDEENSLISDEIEDFEDGFEPAVILEEGMEIQLDDEKSTCSQHLEEPDPSCEVCSHQTSEISAPRASNSSLQCKICLRTYSKAGNLHKHILSHSNEKPHECNICNKVFTQRGSLKRHLAIHGDTKDFRCTICNREFWDLGRLTQHKMMHTHYKKFPCSMCDRQFTYPWNLRAHEQLHTEGKKFECPVCSTCFATRGGLKGHMLIHSGVRNFQCSVCGKAFIRNFHLKMHMIMHTGEKEFECSICSKRFTQRSHLAAHVANRHTPKSKTEAQVLQCPECPKRFICKGSFRIHRMSHSGEYQVTCPVCSKIFPVQKRLTEHMRIHKSKDFECSICFKRFVTQSKLNTHAKCHEKNIAAGK